MISVSTAFFPGAPIDTSPADLILSSTDSVLFYVHSARLMRSATSGLLSQVNARRMELLTIDNAIQIPQISTVLNIVMHCIYGLSCTHFSPTIQDIETAVHALEEYGVPSQSYCASTAPLYHTILTLIPTSPLTVYSIAASIDNRALASIASSHLLSLSLSSISEEMSIKIGPVYLKRLFFLHLGRAQALKALLLPPPRSHPPTDKCTVQSQESLGRAWALAGAYLSWDDNPNVSANFIELTLSPLGEKLDCELCKETLGVRIQGLITQWAQVKVFVSLLLE